MNNQLKVCVDAVCIVNVVMTIVGYLPAIAALASILWTSIQIYDWYQKRKKD